MIRCVRRCRTGGRSAKSAVIAPGLEARKTGWGEIHRLGSQSGPA